MALSKLLKHIYHNATDEVIRRGKKIFHTGGVQLVENDPITETATFRVRNDIYYNQYRVKVDHYGLEHKRIITRCQCPYNMGAVCKHEAAALFQLNDLMESGFFDNVELTFDQSNTTVRMRQITQHFLKLFSSAGIYNRAIALKETSKAIDIKEAAKDTVHALVKENNGQEYPVIIRQNEERYFDTSCPCDEHKHSLCVHKVAVFLQLFEEKGSHYFSTIRDWDAQKKKLLSLYGYSLKDDLSGKFEFGFNDGKLFMRVLNPSIKKIALQPLEETLNKEVAETSEPLRYGVVLEKKGKLYPFTKFQLISGQADKNQPQLLHKIKRCISEKYISAGSIGNQDRMLITAIRKISSENELSKYIKRNLPFGELLHDLEQKLKTDFPEEDLKRQIWDFYLPRYQNLLHNFFDFHFTYYLHSDKSFSKKNLIPIQFSQEDFGLKLIIKPNSQNGDILIKRDFIIEEQTVASADVEIINDGLIKVGNKLIAAQSIDMVWCMAQFNESDTIKISTNDWSKYLEEVVLPLSKHVVVEFADSLKSEVPTNEPDLKLQLQETEKFMIFKPIFAYGNLEREWMDSRLVIWPEGGVLKIQNRDMAAEQTFLTLLRYLHPEMQESRKSAAFLLPVKMALSGDWYFEFREKMEEAGIQILGFENLKKLKINPNKPKTQLQIATGIDWFDAGLTLQYGEEEVTIAAVKKALAKKQNYVSLQDGSIGLLPDDWMKKYSLLVKMGTLNGSHSLRIKKIHFSALENVEEDINDIEIRKQIEERRAKMLSFNYEQTQAIDLPENVIAELRPYQQAGFKWMNFLNETGWGGILADDMGLGKTLQALTYLQYYKNNIPKAFFLIICPTTLIYNWENELNKFTPDMPYAIHHGSARSASVNDLKASGNLIITTYGTLRSDIKMLSTIDFDYVVLDESQAIKNPISQVARASKLLNSKNRLALSGTPVQNNTFDLFAQMDFLNPGMLGTMEFFRNEFAVPIDKMQDKNARDNLKKLINPFLLRRTKEQVAPDLPEKTETILYCEMGSPQKRIYNAYKNSFRTKILGEIDEKGLGRAKLSVLTGLMKLRQICDSPAILNEEEKFDNHSVKINELIRELVENTGEHKALVFSQFLGMLGLIRGELERLNIPYVYFDGSTNTKDREKAIQKFQNDKGCKVFLISLKAGGVGLNLTAADYVYIVDPWWNPTVEQQAIDRTHRIGQTKNIFAYRLICKDTIEEKILRLQDRKLNLAKELIADENAFVKKLSREDIAYLLS